ncbi:MAG TPA: hypothetical protein VM510_05765 [Caulifigura sp.]|nr:hypothetical protein [Caulifigura sp.]
MRRFGLAVILTAGFGGPALAQEPYTGPSSFGAQETLFRYDDQEPWKHGWKKQMPYHEGFHSFRPYNYHHVFGQTQAAAAYGQSMPYSQQWWHRYQSVSAQYNHLQGQPPMAIPQYNTPQVPSQSPITAAPVMNSSPGTYMTPPAPMNIDPVYEQSGSPIDSFAPPPFPAPLMPVN